MSERHACRLMELGRSTHRYRLRKPARDAILRARLKELAARRMRFGYRRLTAMLVREGVAANHKRVYRLYREEGLALRIRQRRRIRWSGAVVATPNNICEPQSRGKGVFLRARALAGEGQGGQPWQRLKIGLIGWKRKPRFNVGLSFYIKFSRK